MPQGPSLRHSRRRGTMEIDEEQIMSSTQARANSLQKSLGKLFVIGGGIIGLEMGTVSCGAV
jgi:pyruvate/2-oxoglutarate dehydrogenase complex dihydrolipoamide dehydrogenase (E3) component